MNSETMTNCELQYRICYAIVVAGKSADFARKALTRLFPAEFNETPFETIKAFIDTGHLCVHLESARTGNYKKIERAFVELATSNIDLRTCSVEQLEAIHGIGPKTARFFILWTRPGVRYAALDVHILRWLRAQGYDAPRSTPSGRKYVLLEKVFLKEADARGLTPGELDAQIWEAATVSRNLEVS